MGIFPGSHSSDLHSRHDPFKIYQEKTQISTAVVETGISNPIENINKTNLQDGFEEHGIEDWHVQHNVAHVAGTAAGRLIAHGTHTVSIRHTWSKQNQPKNSIWYTGNKTHPF